MVRSHPCAPFRGHSSEGRAPVLQAGCRRFDSVWLHQVQQQVFLKIFPSSHLGEGCRLLTGEGRFESCDGSQSRLCLLAVRNLPSQGGNTGSNPVGGSNHLPVAQMDERPATNREACRFDSCREGQSAGCSSVGRAPRLGRGGRRIVTCHPDQIPLSLNGRALRSERRYGGSIPSRGANLGAVAKRERGALQKRHESARHRPAPPCSRGSNG